MNAKWLCGVFSFTVPYQIPAEKSAIKWSRIQWYYTMKLLCGVCVAVMKIISIGIFYLEIWFESRTRYARERYLPHARRRVCLFYAFHKLFTKYSQR